MNAQTMLGLLTEAAVKSTPVLAAALLIVRFQRRSTAARRHAILTAGVFIALALPLVTAALPPWRLAVLPASHGSGSKLRPAGPLLLEIAGERDHSVEAPQDKLLPVDLERLVDNAARVDVEMDMARLNLACHLYQHDNATWPASLDDLHAYVSQVPIDRLGDGKQKIGYVVIGRGLPDGSDRPLIYSRYGSTGPLFYRSTQPGYDFYWTVSSATGKEDFKAGGQFRDVAGWSPADRDHAPPTTRPVP